MLGPFILPGYVYLVGLGPSAVSNSKSEFKKLKLSHQIAIVLDFYISPDDGGDA